MASWLNEIFGFISEAERRSYYLDRSRKARSRAANAESDEDRQAHMYEAIEAEAQAWDY